MPLKYDQIAEVEEISRRIAKEEITRAEKAKKKIKSMEKEVKKNARSL